MGLDAKYDKQRSTRPEEVCFVAPATRTAVPTQWPLSAHSVATQWPHSGHCKYVGCLKESKHMLSRFKLLNARVPRFTNGDCGYSVGAVWGLSGY